jgi:hypothetical protein
VEASGIISEDKIRWAIVGFGPFKTAGEDSIFPAFLKNGIEVLIIPLGKIFTACLAFGYIPKARRKVKEWSQVVLKTMGRIVDQHIHTGPLKSFPLNESQYLKQAIIA